MSDTTKDPTQMTDGELLAAVLDTLDSLAFVAHLHDLISHERCCDIRQLVQVARTSLRFDKPHSHRNGETEPPTEQGHYWFRGLNTRTDHRVRKWVMGKIDRNMVFVYAYGWGRPEEFIGEWHGPIPEPQQENNAK